MDYFEPKTVSEALSLLAKHGAEAKIIAGGTDVMVDIKYKEEPGCLVNIKKIPGLDGIRENGASVRIGALATIRDVETSAVVRDKLPVLWESSHQFASLQIRNTATIGGNICRASPSGETLTPLLVLEAKGKLAFADGERTEPFTAFFQGPGKCSVGSKGLLTEIEVPYPAAGSRGVYLKHAVRAHCQRFQFPEITPPSRHWPDAVIALSATRPTRTPSIGLPSRVQPDNFSSNAPLAAKLPLALDVFFVRLSQLPSATPFRTTSSADQQFGAFSLGWLQSRPL